MCVCGVCSECSPTSRFTILDSSSCSLGKSLIDVADDVRDIATSLGLRPYVVWLVWTRWSKGTLGRGVEEVVKRERLLPTPKVSSMENLDTEILSIGTEETGTLTVSQISGRYTEDFLSGAIGKTLVGESSFQFFWEIEFLQARGEAALRRFSMADVPSYNAESVEWTVQLKRAYRNRKSNGDLGA